MVLQNIGLLIGALLLWCISVVVYRLTLHPLAKYPGPTLWVITDWTTLSSYWTGRWHVDLQEAHSIYGDIVRWGPNKLSFRSAEAVHDIYFDRKANIIKGGGFVEVASRANPPPSTQTTVDREVHAARRRILNHAFSDSALKAMEYLILDTVTKWLNALSDSSAPLQEKSKGWGQPKDMGRWTSNLTIDVLGELCFGKSFNAIEKGSSWIPGILIASARASVCVATIPFRELLYPIMRQRTLMRKLGVKTTKDQTQFRMEVTPLVGARFKLEEETKDKPELQRKDLMHYMIHGTDPLTGEKFANQTLAAEAALFVAAGTDTTSTTLAGQLFYLTRYPKALQKLQHEVRNAFTNIDDIRGGKELSTLPYLRAVIDESLRMSCPVPDILQRQVLPGGAVIAGENIPKDVIVGVSAYSAHHNPQYFPKSFEFIPERWIAGSKDLGFDVTEETVDQAKKAFVPFSVGPRGCVGKNMAMLELNVATARLAWLLDVKKVDDPKLARIGGGGEGGSFQDNPKGRERVDEFQLKNYFIAAREGPFVQFKVRDGITA